MSTEDYPVHPEVSVHSGKTIYRTDEWWKAAVTHSYGGGAPEIAIYLWHRDDEWSRKNKYHVKTAEAWQADKELIRQYLSEEGCQINNQSQYPVSDYYTIDQGETIFKAEEWWKAIVSISQKGSYETHEVIIYLWQQVDGDWRRRQKYAIKNLDDWADDETAVDSLLDGEIEQVSADIGASTAETSTASTNSQSAADTAGGDILSDVEAEVKDLHLGSGVEDQR